MLILYFQSHFKSEGKYSLLSAIEVFLLIITLNTSAKAKTIKQIVRDKLSVFKILIVLKTRIKG